MLFLGLGGLVDYFKVVIQLTVLYVVVIVLCTILVCGYVGYPFVLQGILFLLCTVSLRVY